MAVARDQFSAQVNPAPSWTHTPVGTPRGVIVFVTSLAGSDTVTGTPSYGGVNMTEVTGSPLVKATGEPMACHAFFLGTGIPTGAQTVSLGGTPTGDEIGYCITLTANADTEVVATNASISSDSQADPSSTLALSGRTCFVGMTLGTGHVTLTSFTQLTGWTSENETAGAAQAGACYTYDTIGSTDVTIGWTQTAEDALAIAVAVSEVQATGTDVTATVGISSWNGLGASVATHTNIAAGIGIATFAGLTASLRLSTNIIAGVGTSLWGGNAATIDGGGVPTEAATITGARVFRSGKSRIIYGG